MGFETLEPFKRRKLNIVLQRLYLIGAPKVPGFNKNSLLDIDFMTQKYMVFRYPRVAICLFNLVVLHFVQLETYVLL